MLFHAKNNTAKWKGRNLFSYSVSGMSQVVSTKRVLALVRVKLWPPIFPQKSIATEIILNAKKVYLKPERCNVRMLIHHKGNICILAFTKSNNNNCYNLTGRARTVSPIKYTALVQFRLGKQKVWPTDVWDRKHRAQRLRGRKKLGIIFDITRSSSLVYLTRLEGQ